MPRRTVRKIVAFPNESDSWNFIQSPTTNSKAPNFGDRNVAYAIDPSKEKTKRQCRGQWEGRERRARKPMQRERVRRRHTWLVHSLGGRSMVCGIPRRWPFATGNMRQRPANIHPKNGRVEMEAMRKKRHEDIILRKRASNTNAVRNVVTWSGDSGKEPPPRSLLKMVPATNASLEKEARIANRGGAGRFYSGITCVARPAFGIVGWGSKGF